MIAFQIYGLVSQKDKKPEKILSETTRHHTERLKNIRNDPS